jgi:dihydrolipoamide dehydrogenase
MSAAHLATHPEDISGSVTVLGCSAIAAEAAAIATGLGADTTLVLCGDRLLPGIPEELVDPLRNAAQFEIKVGDIATPPTTDIIVDAAERTGGIAGLGLDTTSVEIRDNWIVVDERMQTSEPRILAAGDCIGPPLWAGAAMHRGRIAAETIAGGHAAWDPAAVAQLSYTDPEICWTGTAQGEHVQSLVVPWTFSGLATVMDRAEGRTMICWDTQSGVLAGIGATGEGACGLADGFTTTLEMGTTLQDLADMVPAHPTRSELLGDAARQALATS